mgnify:CR=1 FL=1
MKYCIIGSGGREHAIAWRLMYDGSADEVYVLPGNGGIEDTYRRNIHAGDFKEISDFCTKKKIDMVVVGPEIPLVAGLVDYLDGQRIPAFGPTKKAAMIEGSKIFAKQIMKNYGIPTGDYREFSRRADLVEYITTCDTYPIVIKLDGLAAGKGVGIPENRREAMQFIDDMVKGDMRVFVEEFLEGEEASVLGISDGDTVLPLVAAQDHKRIYDGDRGLNTGGMGAYAPAPIMDRRKMQRVLDEVLAPAVRGMKKEGIPFKGILYAGLIISGDSIRVLEFNARFGDPETQVILPLLKNRLGDLFQGSVSGTLKGQTIEFDDRYAVTVVLASGGYPGNYEKGKRIHIPGTMADDVLLFHAGTEQKDGAVYTSGGRVLNVTATGATFYEAKEKAYEAVKKISFEGMYFRKDIGHRALKYFA